MITRSKVACNLNCILLISLLVWGCKDTANTGDDGSPSNIVFPSTNVSYAREVQPLFNQTCALVGCHDDGSHPSPLKLTSYGNAVLQLPGIVIPGEPDQSTLVFRIEGRVGARMPLNRNPLNQNQVNGIRTWIAEGGKNN